MRPSGPLETLIPLIILEFCAKSALHKPTLEPQSKPSAASTNNIAQRERPYSHSTPWETLPLRHPDHATAGSGPLTWLTVCWNVFCFIKQIELLYHAVNFWCSLTCLRHARLLFDHTGISRDDNITVIPRMACILCFSWVLKTGNIWHNIPCPYRR